MKQEDIDKVQIKDYKNGMIAGWSGFGILLAGFGFCFPFSIVGIVQALHQNQSVATGILCVIAGGIFFLLSMLFLALGIVCTNNYHKAKHHIARKWQDDPIPYNTDVPKKPH
jgi:TRAP-type C4-dicarboxylate transport system permease large subunit